MRYYSDELKKFFDTEEQCLAEEEKARVAKEEKKITKAKLAKAVEDTERDLEDAYNELEKAKQEVEKLQKEYDKKVDSIMNPVSARIKECSKNRAEAIKKFNDNFGVYTTTYTGNRALNEFAKINNILDNFWNRFYV